MAATAPSPPTPMEDRTSKRLKEDDERRSPPYASMQQRGYPPHYGGPSSAPNYWPPSAPPPPPPYGGQGPPAPHWGGPVGYGPPPARAPPPPPPDRSSWPPGGHGYPRSSSRSKPKPGVREEEMDEPPHPSYWSSGPPPPYGRGGGTNYWQPGMAPMYPSGGWSKSPPRRSTRPDMMGYPRSDGSEMGYVSTRTINPPSQNPHMDDDGASSSAGGSAKDKGRGSYKCGRCGVPKKGHVCPYQPKVKRRPDEPPPETRNAAVQVERDEFMTLRRLNIRIQGFPESYVTEPYMGESMVVGEANPMSLGPIPPPPQAEEELMSDRMLSGGSPPPSSSPPDMPRSSPSPQVNSPQALSATSGVDVDVDHMESSGLDDVVTEVHEA